MADKACWVCGKPADSAEHAVKKSDIVRMAGSKEFKLGERLIKHTADKKIIIQGPNSKYVKYEKSLCKKCNNESTQPYDRAYDKFIYYFIANNDHIFNYRYIRFNKIYGYNAKYHQMNLFKYFVKSFGCQLVEQSKNAPQDFVDFLNGKTKNHNLSIAFSIRDDMPEKLESFYNFYELHDLEGQKDKNTGEEVNFIWAESIGWLRTSYWYKCEPKEHLGNIRQGKSKRLILGQC